MEKGLNFSQLVFSVPKACIRAKSVICNLELEIVKNASHLLSASSPDYINKRILEFIRK